MELKDTDIDIIKEFLIKKIKPFLIYIFGSYAKGTSRSDSDIDIAFLSDEDFSEYEIFMNAQELAGLLNREIDLVDLKKSSTVFKAQVVGTGKTIFCNNDTRRMYFEMYSFKEYALLNEERAVILENIKKRGNIYGE
ncbi:type VII toxin-antitoxin system MntA family adenylyltransferase antitoxin [Clostridium estertheticum]|uniref:type VII toxin-antitoxin system MntA family adenylyltransferase antitoxin n=1 Tax=Clostridium estertheticum TaxID=238834 RepID=UPI001CF566C5|nr:nucleotidyltransferase domain-containing protein [Clostridium estertheticum]MCB2358616.1 nucleotidyltransferase domain-containing protein [Clostridium estertheticum]